MIRSCLSLPVLAIALLLAAASAMPPTAPQPSTRELSASAASPAPTSLLPGTRPDAAFLWEDFATVPDGQLPRGWMGGDNLVVGPALRWRHLYLSPTNVVDDAVMIALDEPLPDNFEINAVVSFAKVDSYSLPVGGFRLEVGSANVAIDACQVAFGKDVVRVCDVMKVGAFGQHTIVTLMKQGNVFTVLVNGKQFFLKRDSAYLQGKGLRMAFHGHRGDPTLDAIEGVAIKCPQCDTPPVGTDVPPAQGGPLPGPRVEARPVPSSAGAPAPPPVPPSAATSQATEPPPAPKQEGGPSGRPLQLAANVHVSGRVAVAGRDDRALVAWVERRSPTAADEELVFAVVDQSGAVRAKPTRLAVGRDFSPVEALSPVATRDGWTLVACGSSSSSLMAWMVSSDGAVQPSGPYEIDQFGEGPLTCRGALVVGREVVLPVHREINRPEAGEARSCETVFFRLGPKPAYAKLALPSCEESTSLGPYVLSVSAEPRIYDLSGKKEKAPVLKGVVAMLADGDQLLIVYRQNKATYVQRYGASLKKVGDPEAFTASVAVLFPPWTAAFGGRFVSAQRESVDVLFFDADGSTAGTWHRPSATPSSRKGADVGVAAVAQGALITWQSALPGTDAVGDVYVTLVPWPAKPASQAAGDAR
jgi:hypothetical protein